MGGWSLRWYSEFFQRPAPMLESGVDEFPRGDSIGHDRDAASATAGRGLALSRGPGFRGRTPVFRHALCAAGDARSHPRPVAAAVCFVALNAERGFWTVTIRATTR